MFKITSEYKKIKTELNRLKILDEIAWFNCYADSTATFTFLQGSVYYQFEFICEGSFFSKMPIIDLLELQGITFFSYSKFNRLGGKIHERTTLVSWSMYKNNMVN
jgi:hypothetical protein